ncbi:unnamed protein product [Trifolium pratense]|uniref:Uncharacterized protein n=1 Tax=Trifolium pratense TaxID=57577 RepID=A0ACB0IUP7_TRIPR|nr:unnamed protein product [Trifolium pratense]
MKKEKEGICSCQFGASASFSLFNLLSSSHHHMTPQSTLTTTAYLFISTAATQRCCFHPLPFATGLHLCRHHLRFTGHRRLSVIRCRLTVIVANPPLQVVIESQVHRGYYCTAIIHRFWLLLQIHRFWLLLQQTGDGAADNRWFQNGGARWDDGAQEVSSDSHGKGDK